MLFWNWSNILLFVKVCGHRWIENKTSDYYMEGACFGGKTTENGTTFYKPLHKQRKSKKCWYKFLHLHKHISLNLAVGQLTSISGVRVYNTAQAQLGFSAQFSQSKEVGKFGEIPINKKIISNDLRSRTSFWSVYRDYWIGKDPLVCWAKRYRLKLHEDVGGGVLTNWNLPSYRRWWQWMMSSFLI